MNENLFNMEINPIKTTFFDFLSFHQNPENLFTLLYPIHKSDNEEIYKAIYNKTREIFCIKIFLYEKNIYNKKKEEIFLIKSLKNIDSILKYVGSFYSMESKKIWMIYEYHECGSILDLGKILDRNFTEEEIALTMNDILHSLIYIHQLNIVNRNIKCKNIIVNNKGKALLSNFERAFQKLNINNENEGLNINNNKDDTKDIKYDIFLIGITCIEMFTGIKKKFNRNKFLGLIKNGRFSSLNILNININNILENEASNEFFDFITKCLELNSIKRPSAYELINHNFIKKYLNEKNRQNFANIIKFNIEKIENNKKEKYDFNPNKKTYSFYISGKSNTKNTYKSGITSKDKSSLNISYNVNNISNNKSSENKSLYVDKLAEFRIEQMKKNEIIEYDKYTGNDLYSNWDDSEDSFVDTFKASAAFGQNNNNSINNDNKIKEKEDNLDNLIIKESDDLDFKSKWNHIKNFQMKIDPKYSDKNLNYKSTLLNLNINNENQINSEPIKKSYTNINHIAFTESKCDVIQLNRSIKQKSLKNDSSEFSLKNSLKNNKLSTRFESLKSRNILSDNRYSCKPFFTNNNININKKDIINLSERYLDRNSNECLYKYLDEFDIKKNDRNKITRQKSNIIKVRKFFNKLNN